MGIIVRLLINALALWLTTVVVAGVQIVSFAPGGTLEVVLTFLIVAAVFGIVNGVLGNLIRIVAFPLYVLTLGLLAGSQASSALGLLSTASGGECLEPSF